jgi:hypothetical protein
MVGSVFEKLDEVTLQLKHNNVTINDVQKHVSILTLRVDKLTEDGSPSLPTVARSSVPQVQVTTPVTPATSLLSNRRISLSGDLIAPAVSGALGEESDASILGQEGSQEKIRSSLADDGIGTSAGVPRRTFLPSPGSTKFLPRSY